MMPSQKVYKHQLHLVRKDQKYQAFLCLSNQTIDFLTEQLNDYLHPKEWTIFQALKAPKRIHSYAIGRYCAKLASNFFFNEQNLAKINISSGVFEHPTIEYPWHENIRVSISHSDQWGGAISFSEKHPMAIDLEVINPDRKSTIASQLTVHELKIIQNLPLESAAAHTLIWTLKEALSKVFFCGLMTPLKVFEVEVVSIENNLFISKFKNFGQYKGYSFLFGSMALSITLPARSSIQSDFSAFASSLQANF